MTSSLCTTKLQLKLQVLALQLILLLLVQHAERSAANCNTDALTCKTGTCTPATGVGKCVCPTPSMITGTACDTLKLYSTTTQVAKTANDPVKSQSVALNSGPWVAGIPLADGQVATSCHICSNGYVTFNRDFCTTRVQLLSSAGAPPYVAPFATALDFRTAFADSKISYKLVNTVADDAELKWLTEQVTELTGTTAAMVVTWEKVAPPKAQTVGAARQATIQLFLFTDFVKKTVAVMHYQSMSLKNYFTWLPTHISWKGMSGTAQMLAADRVAASALAAGMKTIGGVQAKVQVAQLYNNATNVNSRKVCEDQNAMTRPTFNANNAKLCPSTLQQAMADSRYRRSTSAGGQTHYNLTSALVANATGITCAYHNATGAYLLRSSTSQIFGHNSTDFYSACCVAEPSLCNKYWAKFPRPTFASYAAPNRIGYVTGAGIFRTLDGQEYRFMQVGDYRLLSSTKQNVHIRMQDTNDAAKNSAAVTGFAANFIESATILTVEAHWNKATKKFATVRYSLGAADPVTLAVTSTAQQVNQGNAQLSVTDSALTCYVLGRNYWISAKVGQNGLTVSVYAQSTMTGITGLLGNNDGNAGNDVIAATDGATGITGDGLKDSTAVTNAMKTWTVASSSSLFKNPAAAPEAASGWALRYWLAAWDSNSTKMIEDLFAGNGTVFGMAHGSCSSRNNGTTQYKNCLMEYSDCRSSSCATSYIALLDSTAQALASLACTAPQWKTTPVLKVTEGTEVTQQLNDLVDAASVPVAKRVFMKLTGPANLTVTGTQLTWLPSASDLAPIAIVLKHNDTGCSSVWNVKVEFTRTVGACDSAAGTETVTSGGYSPDDILLSSCSCKANYYASNCSFSTCDLKCHSCSSTAPTNCAAACPSNYETDTIASLRVCWFQDRCTSSVCNGAPYRSNGCHNVPPTQQTSSFRYQCTCNAGYQYEVTGGTANRQTCVDIAECSSSVLNTCNANQSCAETAGSFKCNCKSGFTLSSGSCVDVDECAADSTSNTCVAAQSTCVNTVGGFRCNCKSGYLQATSKTCTAINECSNPFLSGCEQQCTNTVAGFTCACHDGFTLDSDAKTCTQNTASKCTATPARKCEHFCVKSGSPAAENCLCRHGFTLAANKLNCTATTATYCSTANICGPGGTCAEMSPTGYNCTCAQYHVKRADGKCAKIDYCNDETQRQTVCPTGPLVTCTVHATTNEPTCACNAGYNATVGSPCQDINECSSTSLNKCHSATTMCRNIRGSFKCACKIGYSRINATHCKPAPNTYNIGATFGAYTFSAAMADTNSVEFAEMADFLESQMRSQLPADGGSNSPTVTIRSMRNGSVIVNGSVSYETAKPSVEDVKSAVRAAGATTVSASMPNECAGANDCTAEHNCVNTDAGYMCQCKSGYTKSGFRKGFPPTKIIDDCVDVNECLTTCREANKTCTNVPGNYSCVCANGTYSADPRNSPCEDPCRPGRCQNSGSCQYQSNQQFPYRCVCMAGYVGFHCELTDDNYWSVHRNMVIVGIVLGILLLLALVLIAFFILRRYRSSKNRADFYQSNFAESPARQNAGTYKGTQSVPMADTSIPRAQPSSQHPSSYENRGYQRDQQQRQRTDYF